MDGGTTNNGNATNTVTHDNISAINIEIDGADPSSASKSPTIGVAFGILALLCMIAALVVNDISGHTLVDDTDTYSIDTDVTTCKWNKYKVLSTSTSSSSSSSSSSSGSIYYQDYCEKEDEYKPADHYICQAYKSGAVFVAFGICSIVISACVILAAVSSKLQKRIQSFVCWIFLTCAVFVLIALIVWSTVNTNDKSDDTLINKWYFRSCFDVGDEDNYIGPSYILYLLGGTFYLVAFILTFLHRNTPFEEKVKQKMEGGITNNGNNNASNTVTHGHISAVNIEVDGVDSSSSSKSLYPTIGVSFGLLAFLCMIAALVVNDISGYKYDTTSSSSSITREAVCKWNEYRLSMEYTTSSESSSSSNGLEYQYWCEKETIEYEYLDRHYYCQVYRAGAVFVAFGVCAIVISGCVILAAVSAKLQKRIQSFVSWIFLVCAVFVLIALIVWSTVNANDKSADIDLSVWYFRACFDTGDKDYYIGPSYILYVIGGTFYLVAFLVTFLYRNIPFKAFL